MNFSSDLSLSRFHTLPVIGNDEPTLSMVKAARVYAVGKQEIPMGRLCSATMRDLYKILTEELAVAFISENDVFITRKDIACPKGMKKVAVEDLALSFDMPVVRIGIANYLLNEVLPCVSPSTACAWSVEFLTDFDTLLSIPIRNKGTKYMETYNFRNLHHRICVRQLDKAQLDVILAGAPHYKSLIEMFQYNSK